MNIRLGVVGCLVGMAVATSCSSNTQTPGVTAVDAGLEDQADSGADAATVDSGDGFVMDGAFRCCLSGTTSCCGDAGTTVCLPLFCIAEGTGFDTRALCAVCCGGLTEIDASEPTNEDGGMVCRDKLPGSMVCTRCGDGTCADRENYCNCPADCPKPDGG